MIIFHRWKEVKARARLERNPTTKAMIERAEADIDNAIEVELPSAAGEDTT